LIPAFNPVHPDDKPYDRNQERDCEHHVRHKIKLAAIHTSVVCHRDVTRKNTVQYQHHRWRKEIETHDDDSLIHDEEDACEDDAVHLLLIQQR